MKLITCVASLLNSLLLFSAISAAETSQRFINQGKVTSFNKESHSLLVRDSGYDLSPTVKILSPTGQQVSVDALRPGVSIQFNLQFSPGMKVPVITEILVMPSN